MAEKKKEYVVLEDFIDRNGNLFKKDEIFPAENYSAGELKIYITAENNEGRAVVAEK